VQIRTPRGDGPQRATGRAAEVQDRPSLGEFDAGVGERLDDEVRHPEVAADGERTASHGVDVSGRLGHGEAHDRQLLVPVVVAGAGDEQAPAIGRRQVVPHLQHVALDARLKGRDLLRGKPGVEGVGDRSGGRRGGCRSARCDGTQDVHEVLVPRAELVAKFAQAGHRRRG
jgi:hypothetical protein